MTVFLTIKALGHGATTCETLTVLYFVVLHQALGDEPVGHFGGSDLMCSVEYAFFSLMALTDQATLMILRSGCRCGLAARRYAIAVIDWPL